jgi:16S rRNA (uracil1498-N3)-methyltransferase
MRRSRLYVPQPLHAGALIQLDDESAHYLRTVMRLKRGDELVVFDGAGGEFPAVLTEAHRDGVRAQLGERMRRDAESALTTRLGLGISRGERMDWAIQKAVELGVSAITPLLTEHCVVHLDQTRTAQRRRHWQRIAQSACEQCGRNRLPEIHEPTTLATWVGCRQGLGLFLHPHGGSSLHELTPPAGPICLLSGPEGGFSEGERLLALEAGFVPLRLGPRILRTETAALAALAAIQTLWGDLG